MYINILLIYVHEQWCLLYFPKEFPQLFVIVVYIQPKANMPSLPLLKLCSIFSHYTLLLLWEIWITIVLCLRPWIISYSMLPARLDGTKYWTTVIARSWHLITPLWRLLWACQTTTPHIWSLVTRHLSTFSNLTFYTLYMMCLILYGLLLEQPGV